MLDHSKFTKIEPIPLDRVKPERCIPFTIPIHIKGACLTMKALKNWRNRDYLKDVFRNAPVELEVYKKPEDVEISKCHMENSNFNSYLDDMGWIDKPSILVHTPDGDCGCHQCMHKYLPDCSLQTLRHYGNIHHDVFRDLDNAFDLQMGLPDIPNEYFMFLGKDNKSGAHCHMEDDFYVNMIVGTKTFYLMPFHDMEINHILSKRNNFTKENFFQMDYDKHLASGKKIYYVTLEEGDTLCIPPWWWHAVDNHGYTAAVTKIYERNDVDYLDEPQFKTLKNRTRLTNFVPELIQRFIKKWFR